MLEPMALIKTSVSNMPLLVFIKSLFFFLTIFRKDVFSLISPLLEKPVEKKEEEKPVEPVEEIPMPVEVEAYMVEPYENKFTSDVRDVNNQNYMSYVFGGKLEK